MTKSPNTAPPPRARSDFERTELNKDKTGVRIEGLRAVNPVNGKEIPVWVSDYVLMGYGTGAIMAVPAHDERDWAFAKKFGMPIVEVVAGGDMQQRGLHRHQGRRDGQFRLPGRHDGRRGQEEHHRLAAPRRDWASARSITSCATGCSRRQRYWGEPIPLVKCDKCGWVPVP